MLFNFIVAGSSLVYSTVIVVIVYLVVFRVLKNDVDKVLAILKIQTEQATVQSLLKLESNCTYSFSSLLSAQASDDDFWIHLLHFVFNL